MQNSISSKTQTSQWLYRGEMNSGQGEGLIEETESISSRGFLKLHLSTDLPANRTGYYYCSTTEYITETNTQ
ncbi:hypothetical protein LOD99_14652 [Oopsacas minuta]|uniref:Immunoglobulin V-set domain-containing protein n=1 Tax=Oopsacas minuta TaxID=111878 RepID=A0AAV7KF19_9METZ|nr:hypothetical protein LOD99_14652 [Oopsacas minuta]